MSFNTHFSKKKNIIVLDLLVCTHKFIVVICFFWTYVYSLTLIFIKMYKNITEFNKVFNMLY